MNDLNTLLERAAGPATGPVTGQVDAAADLSRGRRALGRTRRRRSALGLVGVAAAGVLGIGVSRVVAPDHDNTRAEESTHRDGGISFLSQPFVAGPYTFDATPEGWEVQGSFPQGVTIAPVGFPDQQPLSFVGKLVIMFDGNPPYGDKVELDGRTFWVSDAGGGGATTISTRTQDGEPAGMVRIQYPVDTGWTRDTMLQFLAGVHVGAGAQQGLG
jgi:hypothetical protein